MKSPEIGSIVICAETGGYWYGKGSGAGMCITLRPMKGGK